MSDRRSAVVVGSGALGTATAWHLMRRGLDVALVDRGDLVSQTSPRAAGMALQIQADDILSPIARLGIKRLVNFEADTGQPLQVHQTGSLKVARSESDERQLHREVQRGTAMGVEVHEISAHEAGELAPWFTPGDALACWYAPHDLYLEPGDLPRAYVAALREGGAELRPHTEVTKVLIRDGAVDGVETNAGRIPAGNVVLAAGAWNNVLAARLGVMLPLWPVRHELCITVPHASITNAQPAVRIMDAKAYARPCDGGLMFGAYERQPLAVDIGERGEEFTIADLPIDEAPLREKAATVADELPLLGTLQWAQVRGGLPTMTPDGHFVVDRLRVAEGLWTIGGCNVGGLSTSPALAGHLAEWMATGRRPEAIAPFGADRFGDRYTDAGALRRACMATYSDKYADEEVIAR